MYATMKTPDNKSVMSGDYRTMTALKEYGVLPYWNSVTATEMKVEYFSSIDSLDPFKTEQWTYSPTGTHVS